MLLRPITIRTNISEAHVALGVQTLGREPAASCAASSMQECVGILTCLGPSEDETADDANADDFLSSIDNERAAMEMEPPPHMKEPAENSDLIDDTSGIVTLEEHHPESQSIDCHHRRPRLFIVMSTSVLVGSMGMAIFGVLAGGKWGYALPKDISEAMVYGTADISVSVNIAALGGDPATSSADLRKRGACWLTIGIL